MGAETAILSDRKSGIGRGTSYRRGKEVMKDSEKEYLEAIHLCIENLGKIQTDFVQQKHGVLSLIKFIKNIEGVHPELDVRDPIMIKAQKAATAMMELLLKELSVIREMDAPPLWSRFHEVMIASLELQVEGYREMLRAFEDSDIKHIGRGKDIVKKGMCILEEGTHVI
jgi:hypothetical protein